RRRRLAQPAGAAAQGRAHRVRALPGRPPAGAVRAAAARRARPARSRPGPPHARSSWNDGAVWLSLAVGPMFLVGHQHYDRGHFTLQRGADYRLINGGQFGGGARGTVPFSNSLGFDDRGAGNLIVYPNPPSQGGWESLAQNHPPKFLSKGGFVYGQEELTPSDVNNDAVHNAAKRAGRTVGVIRPDVVVLHDQAQTFNAGVRKVFNVNFAET